MDLDGIGYHITEEQNTDAPVDSHVPDEALKTADYRKILRTLTGEHSETFGRSVHRPNEGVAHVETTTNQTEGRLSTVDQVYLPLDNIRHRDASVL